MSSKDLLSDIVDILLIENESSKSAFKILISTWDGHILPFKYDITYERIKELNLSLDLKAEGAPIMGLTAADNDNCIFSYEKRPNESVIMYANLEKQSLIQVGTYKNAINQLIFKDNRITAFSWDNTMNVWDLKSSNNPIQSIRFDGCVSKITYHDDIALGILETPNQAHKQQLFSMDLKSSSLKLDKFKLNYSEYSKYPMQSICINPLPNPKKPNLLSACVGTLDGALVGFDFGKGDKSSNWVVFSHREEITQGVQVSFPIHTASFHPSYEGAVFSGGGDGKINVNTSGDYKTIIKEPLPVNSLKLNNSGHYLIETKGYDWTEGPKFGEKSQLYVHKIEESDFPS